MISGIAPVMGFISSGTVKPLVVSAKQRVAVLADVPTAAEAGIPEFQAYAWNGLLAPRGTPQPMSPKSIATSERGEFDAGGQAHGEVRRLSGAWHAG